MTSDPLWTGIHRHGAGWRAVVSRGRGRTPVLRHFAKETDPRTMQTWRADTQATLRLERKRRAFAGTFEADAKKYLKAVTALPTIQDRRRDIGLWIAIFGTTDRDRITSADIRAERDRWLTAPRSSKDTRPLAPGTVNKRLRALSNLWTVLDGPRATNPVRDVPEADEAPVTRRTLDFATIDRVIAAMPDVTRPEKGKPTPAGSLSKARIRVLAYTGWPGGVLGRLSALDLDLEAGTARLPARRKGKGADAVTVALLPQAIDALRDLIRLGGLGPFSRSSLWKSLNRAFVRLQLDKAKVYDLRHHFLSVLGQASGDERAVQAIAQHADIRTTRTYTEPKVAPRVTAALAKLVQQMGTTGEGSSVKHSDKTSETASGPVTPTQRTGHEKARIVG